MCQTVTGVGLMLNTVHHVSYLLSSLCVRDGFLFTGGVKSRTFDSFHLYLMLQPVSISWLWEMESVL
jgi:hypothetical protein